MLYVVRGWLRCEVGDIELDRTWFGMIMRVSMGLTDRRKTAKNLVDSRKNGKILTVSRKLGKKELTVKEIVP